MRTNDNHHATYGFFMQGLTRGLEGLGTMLGTFQARLAPLTQMLNVSVVTTVINVVVITLVVYMLVAAGLDRQKTALDTEIAVNPPRVSTPGPPPKSLPGPRARRLEDYRSIAARDLFGTEKQAARQGAASEEEVKIEKMPPASLQLKLLGTAVTSDAAMRTAIIAEAGGRNERMYREGEDVKGATIKKILRYAVVLNTGKRDEVLKMEVPRSSKPGSPTTRVDEQTPIQVVTLGRDEAQKTLGNIFALFQSAAFERYRSGGVNGFRLKSAAPNSVVSRLGLRNKDIVLGVNGQPLSSLEQNNSLYDQLERGGQVLVNIKRFGRDQDIALRLQ